MILSLEKLVTTLETSRRMKKLGFPQETVFYWVRQSMNGKMVDDWIIFDRREPEMIHFKERVADGIYIAAYLSSEVGEILPYRIKWRAWSKDQDEYLLITSGKNDEGYYCDLTSNKTGKRLHTSYAPTESEARGLLACWLKEQGLI